MPLTENSTPADDQIEHEKRLEASLFRQCPWLDPEAIPSNPDEELDWLNKRRTFHRLSHDPS